MCRQIVFGDKKEIKDLEVEKSTIVKNTALATRGKTLGLHRIIRSSQLTIQWGNPQAIPDGVVADVFEAVIGSVAYHEQNPHNKIVFAGYMFDQPDRSVRILKSFFDEGGIPAILRDDLHYMDPYLQNEEYKKRLDLLQRFQK